MEERARYPGWHQFAFSEPLYQALRRASEREYEDWIEHEREHGATQTQSEPAAAGWMENLSRYESRVTRYAGQGGGRLAAALDKHLFAAVDPPQPFDPEEVLELACAHLLVLPEHFETGFANWCRAVQNLPEDEGQVASTSEVVHDCYWAQEQHLCPFYAVCFSRPGILVKVHYWDFSSDFALADEYIADQHRFQVILETVGLSPRARYKLTETLRDCVPSYAATMYLSGHLERRDKSVRNKLLAGLLSRDVSPADKEETKQKLAKWEENPPADPDQDGLKLLEEMLELHYARPGKTERVQHRLRNALQLLVESDKAEHSAVALSLAFASIEALLGRGGSEKIAESIARRAATLLQPDAKERYDAQDAIKKLYDRRSKLLHGAEVDEATAPTRVVRKLSAGVVKAVLDWRRYMFKLGATPDEPAFFDELDRAGSGGTPMPGIPEALGSCLPYFTQGR